MSTNHNAVRNYRRSGCFGAQLFALLALPLLCSAVAADDGGTWQLEPAIDIRTATYFEYSGGSSTAYPAVGTELSIELSSLDRPYTTGLFADFELGSHEEAKHTRLIGSWFSYRYGRWKLSIVAAHYKSNQVNGLWMHASKLQFELRPGHKLAIEAIGAIRGSDAPGLQLVYNTYLTRQASLSIQIGLGPNRMRDFGASTNFVWNVY